MFQYKTEVYYEDTDAGGVVYYANYLKFIERSRTNLIQNLGFTLNQLTSDFDSIFVVRKINCEFLAPAKLEDELIVKTKILEIKNASFTLSQDIEKSEKIIFSSKILMVCINSAGKPIKIPTSLSVLLHENI